MLSALQEEINFALVPNRDVIYKIINGTTLFVSLEKFLGAVYLNLQKLQCMSRSCQI